MCKYTLIPQMCFECKHHCFSHRVSLINLVWPNRSWFVLKNQSHPANAILQTNTYTNKWILECKTHLWVSNLKQKKNSCIAFLAFIAAGAAAALPFLTDFMAFTDGDGGTGMAALAEALDEARACMVKNRKVNLQNVWPRKLEPK